MRNAWYACNSDTTPARAALCSRLIILHLYRGRVMTLAMDGSLERVNSPDHNKGRCPPSKPYCSDGFHFLAAVLLLQLDSTYYRTYPERLASWGYVVVRYDTGIIIQTDKKEVRRVGALPQTPKPYQGPNIVCLGINCFMTLCGSSRSGV